MSKHKTLKLPNGVTLKRSDCHYKSLDTIKAEIEKAAQAGGGVVHIPAGSYALNMPIRWHCSRNNGMKRAIKRINSNEKKV